MKIAAVIPARYHSTRFIGKALVKIKGIPMIERVYRQVEKSKKFNPNHIIVATDDQRIFDVVQAFGGKAVMTSKNHKSGTERIWEVAENSNFEGIINIQGDEPIVSEKLIIDIYEQLEKNIYDVITPAYYNPSYDDYLSKNVVKVVTDKNFIALYFSRSPIPYYEKRDFKGFYHHIGMYGYLKNSLRRFVELPISQLEKIEKLEQLRFIDNNIKIKVVTSKYPSVGVDVPEDILLVEKILANKSN